MSAPPGLPAYQPVNVGSPGMARAAGGSCGGPHNGTVVSVGSVVAAASALTAQMWNGDVVVVSGRLVVLELLVVLAEVVVLDDVLV
jgi:hypothetical protein